jgi:putative SOS response-associated peptidase YedK
MKTSQPLACLFALARANDITSGEPLLSCTMIVTEANEFADRIHDRMPVFLPGDSFETWLDGSSVELLCSAPENCFHLWPVPKRANRSGTGGDDPTLIDRTASREWRPFALRLSQYRVLVDLEPGGVEFPRELATT